MYLHHVPGRLRIRAPHLKRNHKQAESARLVVSQILGVRSAEVNLVTGSLTVLYDHKVVAADVIIGTLQDTGHIYRTAGSYGNTDLIARPARPSPSLSPALVRKSVDRVSKAVATAAMEKLLERSAAALISALI